MARTRFVPVSDFGTAARLIVCGCGNEVTVASTQEDVEFWRALDRQSALLCNACEGAARNRDARERRVLR